MLTEATHPDVENPWATAWAADRSPVSERLVRALEAHEAAEAESLDSYHQLADASGDVVVAALVRLVIEDEKRHQQLLLQMTAPIDRRDGLDGALAPVPLSPDALEDRTAAIVATRALIREEREGARHLRHLARQEHQLHDGVYAILLESMARDSEKHEHILRYVLKRLEGSE